MIQTRTALCVIAAVASGLFLYSEKREALMTDREIASLLRATADLHTRTVLLRAEWASMLGPDQLQTMSAGHLTLQPVAPAQFVQLDQLGAHLPPPEAPASAAIDSDDAAAALDGSAGSTVRSIPTTAPSPSPPAISEVLPSAVPLPGVSHRAPVASAASQQAAYRPASPKSLSKPAVKHGPAQHGLVLAGGQDRPFVVPRPVAGNAYRGLARPLRPTDPAMIETSPGQQMARSPVASALGNGVALPPPVPYGQ